MAADVLILDEAAEIDEAPREKRGAVRHPAVQRCLVRRVGVPAVGPWHAIAYNVSANGIGLALGHAFAEGTLLAVELWGKNHVRPIQARVVHSSVVSYLLFHGCELTAPLGPAELRSWLS